MSNELICPKCGSSMRSYERNGVVVDQCTGCGGLFLDKGELEKLSGYREESDSDYRKPKKKKSKKSFLEDLLEF